MRVLLAAIALCTVAVVAHSPLTEREYFTLFDSWVTEHKGAGFQYPPGEEVVRYQIWRSNMDLIINHNLQNKSWTLAMNSFGDLTTEEFASMMNGYRPSGKKRNNTHVPRKVAPKSSVNWVSAGKVTGIKNQGQCGSCWSFSTTGSVEGAWAMKHPLVSVSEQELVDCDTASGIPSGNSWQDQGCNGGEMQEAMQWIITNGGICSEAAYPYTAQDGTCTSEPSCTNVAHISNLYSVPWNQGSTDESGLAAAATLTPTSVAVDASGSDWQFYSGGVVNDPACYNQLDHGVLVVGYGTQSGQDYWMVKNSWGKSWGMSGFIYLARNANVAGGMCGIIMDASYPIL